jgi:hypothetical protein
MVEDVVVVDTVVVLLEATEAMGDATITDMAVAAVRAVGTADATIGVSPRPILAGRPLSQVVVDIVEMEIISVVDTAIEVAMVIVGAMVTVVDTGVATVVVVAVDTPERTI